MVHLELSAIRIWPKTARNGQNLAYITDFRPVGFSYIVPPSLPGLCDKNYGAVMSTEQNKAIVKEFYRLIEENKYDKVKELCHKDFVFYSQIDTPLDAAGFIRQEKGHMDAFPGFTMRIHEMFAEGDQVACYLIFEGVQAKEFLGVAPTNKKVRFSLMFLLTLKDGKFIQKRAHYNTADILKQLGVFAVPFTGPTLPE